MCVNRKCTVVSSNKKGQTHKEMYDYWISILTVFNVKWLQKNFFNDIKIENNKYLKEKHVVCDCMSKLTPNDYPSLATRLFKNFHRKVDKSVRHPFLRRAQSRHGSQYG